MAGNINGRKRNVVDASFVLSFLLPDESNDFVRKMFTAYQNSEVDFVSVKLLPFEVVNGIKSAVSSKRISYPKAIELVETFRELDFELKDIEENEVLELSISNKITVYDASYLYLSKSKKLKLLTLDSTLQKLQ